MTTNKAFSCRRVARSFLVAIGCGLASLQAQSAATIVINNLNAAGVGFNDATPAAPIGGNPGITLGQQRLFAFSYAANIWGSTLTSSVPIVINAQFSALSCTATSAVLGSAGATSIFRNFPNAPITNTWYSYALANKLAGTYLGTLNNPQINANFNANLGQANCLAGSPFYFGVDGNHGSSIDFVAVLLHEMGHGLGFQTFTNGSSGAQNGGFPSIWDHYLTGTSTGLTWANMTNTQRAASAISVNGLVWGGPLVTAQVPSVLSGRPALAISGPAAGAATGSYSVGAAGFGAPIGSPPVSGQLMPLSAANALACNPLTGADISAVRNNIALISRGTCGFVVKVKNAQDAGAKGVIIVDNVTAAAPPGLGGSDPNIFITAASVTLADGTALRATLNTRSRTASGVIASLDVSQTLRAGADAFNRMFMFAPNPFQSGSSVSHFDVSAFRNQLMEPSINGDLTQFLVPPYDLTYLLLADIGW